MNENAEERETVIFLRQMQSGDRSAEGNLYALVHEELHGIARSLFARQPADHLLQPTALVNEAFLRLTGKGQDWQSRRHFIDVAAKAMRHILVDHARQRRSPRHGGDRQRVPLTDSLVLVTDAHLDVLALEEALQALEARDPRKSRIVTLRFYGGLTMEEIAGLLHVSRKTVEADWYFARSWLQAHMEVEAGDGPSTLPRSSEEDRR